jgi:hypothetical protein
MEAVLEFEVMPSSCKYCVLSTKKCEEWVCAGHEIKFVLDFDAEEIPLFCPLKKIN